LNKIYLFLLIITIVGCTSPKEILYFQDIEDQYSEVIKSDFEPTIKVDDLLSIVVINAADKSVSQPFNLSLGEAQTFSTNPRTVNLPYLVDKEGNIDFPVFRKIHVEGMTRNELVDTLTEKIKKYVNDPIVSIQFMNFRFTVLGEVRNPGTFTAQSEKISILEALGYAGDLTISAKREDILLIREENGVQNYFTIDLKKKDILTSPYYYISQNDIIYVPPSTVRVAQATTATTIWSLILTSLTTTATLITLILTNRKSK
jgi:polysaccharide export outer membrane protein